MSFNWINKFSLKKQCGSSLCVCMCVGIHYGGRALIRRLYSCRWLAAFCFWHIRLSLLYSLRYQWRKSQWSKNDTFFLFHRRMNIEQVVFFRPLDGTWHTHSLNTKLFSPSTAPASVAVSGLCFMSLSLRWKIDSFD